MPYWESFCDDRWVDGGSRITSTFPLGIIPDVIGDAFGVCEVGGMGVEMGEVPFNTFVVRSELNRYLHDTVARIRTTGIYWVDLCVNKPVDAVG